MFIVVGLHGRGLLACVMTAGSDSETGVDVTNMFWGVQQETQDIRREVQPIVSFEDVVICLDRSLYDASKSAEFNHPSFHSPLPSF